MSPTPVLLLNAPNPHLDALPRPRLGAWSPHPLSPTLTPAGFVLRPGPGLSVREADAAPPLAERGASTPGSALAPHSGSMLQGGLLGAGQVAGLWPRAPGTETYTSCSGQQGQRGWGVVSHVIAAGTPGGPEVSWVGSLMTQEGQVSESKVSHAVSGTVKFRRGLSSWVLSAQCRPSWAPKGTQTTQSCAHVVEERVRTLGAHRAHILHVCLPTAHPGQLPPWMTSPVSQT